MRRRPYFVRGVPFLRELFWRELVFSERPEEVLLHFIWESCESCESYYRIITGLYISSKPDERARIKVPSEPRIGVEGRRTFSFVAALRVVTNYVRKSLGTKRRTM